MKFEKTVPLKVTTSCSQLQTQKRIKSLTTALALFVRSSKRIKNIITVLTMRNILAELVLFVYSSICLGDTGTVKPSKLEQLTARQAKLEHLAEELGQKLQEQHEFVEKRQHDLTVKDREMEQLRKERQEHEKRSRSEQVQLKQELQK